MNKKSLWAILVVVIIIVGLAAYVASSNHSMMPATPSGTTAANTQTPATANPNGPGIPVLGAYVSSTATSITIKAQDGSSRSFTISANTPVISTETAGQVAPVLANVKVGASVIVIPSKTDNTMAANIQLVTPPAMPAQPAAGSTFATITGTVASHTASSMVVTNQTDGSNVTIALTKNTQILSNVSAGQKGKGLTDITDGSTYVNVNAVKTGNAYTANTVQILIPIAQTQ